MLGRSYDYYEAILKQINGILLPGGAASSLKNEDYLHTGKMIYKLAAKMNDNGDYFPIWGTCLGFEFLLLITAKDEKDPRQICPHISESLRIQFTNGYKLSKMFKDIKQDVIDILEKQAVTFHNHSYCVTQTEIHKYGLGNVWRETSLSSDSRGFEFVSTIEHKKYPFYGVQFHPEKNAYEFTYLNINHSPNAIKTSRFFANFFVDECRKNTNCFFNISEETRHLIYNFPVIFTRKRGNHYSEVYLFKEYDDYPEHLEDFEIIYDANLRRYVQYFYEGFYDNY